MLNTYNQNLKFEMPPICSGSLQKSRNCSRFIRFHYKSTMAENALTSGTPRLKNGGEEIVILQIMSFGDGELLVEYAYKKELCGAEEE